MAKKKVKMKSAKIQSMATISSNKRKVKKSELQKITDTTLNRTFGVIGSGESISQKLTDTTWNRISSLGVFNKMIDTDMVSSVLDKKKQEEAIKEAEKKMKAEQLKAMVVAQLQAEQEANTSDSKSVIYENLTIPSFDTVHIESFQLEQKLNEHMCMKFSALLDEEMNDDVVYYTQVGCQVEVYYTLRGFKKQKKMFQGMVTDVRVTTEGKVSKLYVTAHSNTIQLDAVKNSYSYQDTGISYESVVNEVLKRNSGAKAIYDSCASSAINNFTLQYKETDWEFIKRLAGQKHLPLVPSYTASKPQFYYGCQFRESVHTLHIKEYSANKNIQMYQKESANYIEGVEEKDYITYTVKAYDMLKLGDKVEFKGVTFYIRNAIYEMEDGIVMGTYVLGRKLHFKQRKYHNNEISGISLNGSVTEIQRDKIKVHLSIDPKASSAKYWFPYSTMSASPDGSGWYCMPKKGDQVRVYFPDVEEKNCYSISSISSYSPSAGSNDKMSDPDVRYLRTPDGMEIKLEPQGITIDAYDGKAVISLDKQGNITINATQNLSITAAESLTVNAEKNVAMYATEDISMNGAEGTIVMKKNGDTVLTGEYVLEN